jgi:hypothetical protein
MSTTLTCPQGHQWQPSAADLALAAAETTCPLCGHLPLTIHPGEAVPAPVGEAASSTGPWDLPLRAAGADLPAVPGYEILGELGRGGMGVVYQARQVKLKRLVALKMILAGAHTGPELRERFRREAEAVARLQHPNIVQIYEVGEHGGLPFFSLEYVDGGSLARQITGTPLPPRAAAARTSARWRMSMRWGRSSTKC